jgi:hypothetical protein
MRRGECNCATAGCECNCAKQQETTMREEVGSHAVGDSEFRLHERGVEVVVPAG